MAIELADKVAVVTGAGSGIGKGAALAFARAGLRVIVADIDLSAAEEVAANLSGEGRQVSAHEVDVADRAGLQRAFSEVRQELGPITIVATSAAAMAVTRRMSRRLN